MAFRPYLTFAGTCREAFTRYREIFGGELVLLTMADTPAEAGPPPAGVNSDAIMHAALTIGDEVLMGSDDMSGSFDGNVNGISVAWSTADVPAASKVFDALAEGGQVQMPVGETFFSPAFGMCTDRFGVPWMIMADMPVS
jgi:PhnB protein